MAAPTDGKTIATLASENPDDVVAPASGDQVVANRSGSPKILTMGSGAGKNAPASGNAAAGEVVLGSDTRMTDQRTPTDGSVTTAKIADGNVTLAKLANMATARLLGRATAGSGAPEELTAAQVKTLLAIAAGDVSGLGALALLATVGAAQIDANAVTTAKIADANVTTAKIADANVTLPKMANLANQRVIGRNTSGAGAPEALTVQQMLEWLGTCEDGDMIVRVGGAFARVAKGTDGEVWKMVSGSPAWAEESGGGVGGSWVDAEIEVELTAVSGNQLPIGEDTLVASTPASGKCRIYDVRFPVVVDKTAGDIWPIVSSALPYGYAGITLTVWNDGGTLRTRSVAGGMNDQVFILDLIDSWGKYAGYVAIDPTTKYLVFHHGSGYQGYGWTSGNSYGFLFPIRYIDLDVS